MRAAGTNGTGQQKGQAGTTHQRQPDVVPLLNLPLPDPDEKGRFEHPLQSVVQDPLNGVEHRVQKGPPYSFRLCSAASFLRGVGSFIAVIFIAMLREHSFWNRASMHVSLRVGCGR